MTQLTIFYFELYEMKRVKRSDLISISVQIVVDQITLVSHELDGERNVVGKAYLEKTKE